MFGFMASLVILREEETGGMVVHHKKEMIKHRACLRVFIS